MRDNNRRNDRNGGNQQSNSRGNWNGNQNGNNSRSNEQQRNNQSGNRRNNRSNNNRRNEERKFNKALDYFQPRPKKEREFKITLGDEDGTTKTGLPIYSGVERDEVLLLLITRFNRMVKDGDLMKDERIGHEDTRNTMTDDNKAAKLAAIKSCYRKFEACLDGKARIKWEKLVDNQETLSPNNYATRNTYSQKNFERNQKRLARRCLEQDAVSNLKAYMWKTKKPRKLTVEEWIDRQEILNEYIPWMDEDATKLTDDTMVKNVTLDNIPEKWLSDLKKANNHKKDTIEDLIEVLRPLEEAYNADEEYRKRNNQQRTRGRQSNNRQNGNTKQDNDNRRGGYRQNSGQKSNRGDYKPNNSDRNESNSNTRRDNESRDVPSNNYSDQEDNDYDNESLHWIEEMEISDEAENSDEELARELNIVANLPKKPTARQVKSKLRTSVIFTMADKAGNRESYLGLLDTGSTGGLIDEALVQQYDLETMRDDSRWDTNAGTFETRSKAIVHGLRFPQFTNNATVNNVTLHVNPNRTQKYKIIFGLDFLIANEFDFILSEKVVKWQGYEVSITQDKEKRNETNIKEMRDNNYRKMTSKEITNHKNQQHLSTMEKEKLTNVIREFEDLFQGTAGNYTGNPVQIKIRKDAKPYHARPYRIPQAQEAVTRKAIDAMIKNNVLEEYDGDSEWAAPTFGLKKKDDGIRIVSDFRKLNEVIVRNPWPMPTIQEMLHKCGGLTYATALDMIMGYYSMNIHRRSQPLLVIILPWGKYVYRKMPMGLKISADVFQRELGNQFKHLPYVLIYVDDILIITKGSYDQHLKAVETVLCILRKCGMQINPDKSYFCKQEVEYLGYIINRQGIAPQPKKVRAIRNMQRPKTIRQLRRFLGMINFYRDTWEKRTHITAPMTKMIQGRHKGPLNWTPEAKQAFERAKEMCSEDALLYYPNFNRRFDIHTDSSQYQMGAVISQDNKPVAYWSKTLTDTQKKYPTTDQELLAIVECLKAYRQMLYGQLITVHTDHKNLTHKTTEHASNRVLRQRLLLEEYGADVQFVPGIKNAIADTLSRNEIAHERETTTSYHDNNLFELFAATIEMPNPICYKTISQAQQDDTELAHKRAKDKRFAPHTFGLIKLWCYVDDNTHRIWVPEPLRHHLLKWYHDNLLHPGRQVLEDSVRKHFYFPNLSAMCRKYRCKTCEEKKVTNIKKQGKIPLKERKNLKPFETLSVDLCGPWRCKFTVERNISEKPNEKKIQTRIEEAIFGHSP